MKELSIEEKAKRYDEAIKRAKEMIKAMTNISGVAKVDDIQYLFPELKESEDEEIRKELITHCRNIRCVTEEGAERIAKWISWLEKQGGSYTKSDVDDAYLEGVTTTKNEIEKQYEASYQIRKDIATFIFNYKGDIKDRAKWMDYLGIKVAFAGMQGEEKPADKVEPKFHEGDLIVNNNSGGVYKVTGIRNDGYCLLPLDGKIMGYLRISDVNNYYHLWTIQDAKAGDVLVDEYNNIAIYKEIKGNCWHSYITLGYDNRLYGFDLGEFHVQNNTKPATKEQRDQLEKAMTDAGYTFDFEKKELKKIEYKPVEPMIVGQEPIFDYTNANIIQKDFAEQKSVEPDDLIEESYQQQADDLIDMVTEKPSWSEEDEKTLDSILGDIGIADKTFGGSPTYQKKRDWLESLKDRVQPDTAEWSEEDETKIKSIIAFLKSPSLCAMDGNKGIIDANIQYLKSLKDRVQPQPKQGWSGEDEKFVHGLIRGLSAKRDIHGHTTFSSDGIDITKTIDWLESLKDRVGCEVNCTTTKEWSEEDDKLLNSALWHIKNSITNGRIDKFADCLLSDWLKSLKDRVQPQPKQEWSEEDEQAIEDAETWLDTLCDYLKDSSSGYIPTVKNVISKLKSLSPQNTWNPSEE